MLDPKFIRDNPDIVRKCLKDRGDDPSRLDAFLSMDEERRKLIGEVEDLKRRKNEASKKIGALIKQKADVTDAKREVNDISGQIESIDINLRKIEEEYKNVLDMIPNLLHESVPVGKDEKDNLKVKEWGKIPDFKFNPRDHIELGRLNGILDLERAARISGSGFALYTGAGARLERALFNFMLDVHTKEHGYKEVFPPFLVNRRSMRGTGQLPKLEEDMYRLKDDDLFLIPTAEVPVTNMHAGDVLKEQDLPVCYTAYTACFRREAGSYGKDTRGLIRVHQFDKVELVKFCLPERSIEELDKLLADAEDILRRLELAYRVMVLSSADISFAGHKCYDIELWAPGTRRWLEVSSCSVFTDFQARRANIRYQPSDGGQKPRYVHTLNGSGVALARLVIALLETHQKEDGSVAIPEALREHFGADSITPGAPL